MIGRLLRWRPKLGRGSRRMGAGSLWRLGWRSSGRAPGRLCGCSGVWDSGRVRRSSRGGKDYRMDQEVILADSVSIHTRGLVELANERPHTLIFYVLTMACIALTVIPMAAEVTYQGSAKSIGVELFSGSLCLYCCTSQCQHWADRGGALCLLLSASRLLSYAVDKDR